jgi:ribonuclease E
MVDDKEKEVKPRRRAVSRPAGPATEEIPIISIEKATPVKKQSKKVVKKTSKKAAATETGSTGSGGTKSTSASLTAERVKPVAKATTPLFQVAAEPVKISAPVKGKGKAKKAAKSAAAEPVEIEVASPEIATVDSDGGEDEASRNRRRRRGGRGRRRKADGTLSDRDSADDQDGESEDSPSERDSDSGDSDTGDSDESDSGDSDSGDSDSADGDAGSTKRRRRRRRAGQADDSDLDDPNTVVRVREPRRKNEEFKGSTRLEAKKQRRKEGRDQGRRRAPILTEAEFLARRESVERVMAIRQSGDRTQIAVLEDGVLVEHYVTRGSATSMVGNVYVGRVQNVLPSMEAAFVDIGKGRNAVLYAGEVNWDAAGLEGQQKRIELALQPGDPILVQVTKDPVGQKGARLTSQISLPGRFLVFVPDGSMTGISRKLPEGERNRLKEVLRRVMPENAGVIVRTAAEGAAEDALEQDVQRLTALWEDIDQGGKGVSPPALLYAEPDIAIKVVRDIFNEDVNKMVVSGDVAWTTVDAYISAVAPDLLDRLEHWVDKKDLFGELRVDEQLLKALDRKVYLPSGGSLVIDRTEAMTVVDVNTGKFTGQGGNLEQTVTKNNLEAAEEIVRQLRLRDIGGIIVVDFIDMVLESNRDQVLRRLIECLGRDRTKHQVAEVTSLGLVQMTRKRIGSGLIESFSETCEVCNGRGIKVSLTTDPGQGQTQHSHHEPPVRYRRPANAVDPAMVAARALEQSAIDEAAEQDRLTGDLVDQDLGPETSVSADPSLTPEAV